MNFLILINGAHNYKSFYYEIAKQLEKKGHKVYYAILSHRSLITEPLKEIDNDPNTEFFDSYCYENRFKSTDKYIFDCSWGEYLYADFDRFYNFNYNLKKDRSYWFEIRIALDSFFNDIINNKNIDIVLYENISNTFAYAAYRCAKRNNKKYLGLMGGRIPNRYEIQSSIIEEELNKISWYKSDSYSEEEEVWFNEYIKNIEYIQPDYMKNNILNKGTNFFDLLKISRFRKIVNYFKMINNKYYKYDFQFGHPMEMIVLRVSLHIKKFISQRAAEKYYLNDSLLSESMQKDDYYIYPIHYHPESSTSILAPNYTDEFYNILNIHNSLPFGKFLYVKDHISSRGVQSELFYKKIAALPGVKIISWNKNVKELIKYSKGVITVNSTVGYEAAIMNKKVFLLGRVFYENFANVIKVSNFLELKESLTKDYPVESIKSDLISYYRYTFSGTFYFNDKNLWSEKYFENIAMNIISQGHE